MKKHILISTFAVLIFSSCQSPSRDISTAESKLRWWQEARYGMFVHWGISSLMGQEISWSREGYGASRYDSLALRFNPVDFDADRWIDVAEAAGMKYIVLTTKHHDGFCLWDSKANPFNIMNTPYHRDVCRQLADAAHRRGMRLGWYFSCREWSDENCCTEGRTDIYVEKMKEELTELLTQYGKVDILWFDFEGCPSPAQPEEIVSLITSHQPDIIFNNRLYPLDGAESHCCVGDFGMFCTPEQTVGEYGTIPWETCSTMSSSRQWSIRFNDPPRPAEDLVWETIAAASGNGNMLMNVGPDSLGVISLEYAVRLAEVGEWIRSHDGILYGTHCGPWKPTSSYISTGGNGNVWLVLREGSDMVLPYSEELNVTEITANNGENVPFSITDGRINLDLPEVLEGVRNVALKVKAGHGADEMEPLSPFGITGSVGYGKSSSASSSMSEVYSHCPASAFDDNDDTAWMVGRRTDTYPASLYGRVDSIRVHIDEAFQSDAVLEVDLDEAKTICSFRILPAWASASAVLEHKSGEEWIRVAVAEPFDGEWKGSITPVSARFWRVSLHGCLCCSGVAEFQLFQ